MKGQVNKNMPNLHNKVHYAGNYNVSVKTVFAVQIDRLSSYMLLYKTAQMVCLKQHLEDSFLYFLLHFLGGAGDTLPQHQIWSRCSLNITPVLLDNCGATSSRGPQGHLED